MILPTVINISESALKAVPQNLKSASLALGASHIQTIFKVMIPAAKSGIITAIVLGTGRAIGLKPGGWLMYEIGCDQGMDVSEIMKKNGFEQIEIKKDLAGLDRVVTGRKMQEEQNV